MKMSATGSALCGLLFLLAAFALGAIDSVRAADRGSVGVVQTPSSSEPTGGAARMRGGLGGGLNETGTWDCSCDGGQGTCTVNRLPDRITCVKGSGNCTGTCKFKSSTTGLGGAI